MNLFRRRRLKGKPDLELQQRLLNYRLYERMDALVQFVGEVLQLHDMRKHGKAFGMKQPLSREELLKVIDRIARGDAVTRL